jgi:hypothetical protein
MAKKDTPKKDAPEERVPDLTVPKDDAAKVKGGAVGPCFRPK